MAHSTDHRVETLARHQPSDRDDPMRFPGRRGGSPWGELVDVHTAWHYGHPRAWPSHAHEFRDLVRAGRGYPIDSTRDSGFEHDPLVGTCVVDSLVQPFHHAEGVEGLYRWDAMAGGGAHRGSPDIQK